MDWEPIDQSARIGIGPEAAILDGVKVWGATVILQAASPGALTRSYGWPLAPVYLEDVTVGDGPSVPRLLMVMHDIEAPADRMRMPADLHIGALLTLLSKSEAPRRVLCLCRAGLSRSPALALVAASALWGGDPGKHVAALRQAAPWCQPNRQVVTLGDRRLGLAGKLSAAVDRLGKQTRSRFGAIGEIGRFVELVGSSG